MRRNYLGLFTNPAHTSDAYDYSPEKKFLSKFMDARLNFMEGFFFKLPAFAL